MYLSLQKRSFDYNDYRIRSKPPKQNPAVLHNTPSGAVIGEPIKKAIDMIVTNATPTITNRLFIINCEIY